MRTKIIIITLLIIAALILISLRLFQSSEGPHGGTVKPAGEYYIEMKNPGGGMYAFLLNKDLKPISNKGITCRARLLHTDRAVTDVKLSFFGSDGFFVELIPRYYVTSTVIFTLPDKELSAEFENEVLFVDKK